MYNKANYRAPQSALLGTLSNGAQVIAREGSCVLAMWDHGTSGVEYVTWRIAADGSCYWGHYFDNIAAAAADFNDRAEKRI